MENEDVYLDFTIFQGNDFMGVNIHSACPGQEIEPSL